VKKIYFIPVIQSQDFSKFHFCKNQGSAASLNGEELQTFDGLPNAPCGFGVVDSSNSLGFCLSGAVPVDQFVGLNVVMGDGSSFEILSCEAAAFSGCDDFGGTFYDCIVSGSPSDVLCVSSIESEGGTLITHCNSTGGCTS
jgi:hypothetical protein